MSFLIIPHEVSTNSANVWVAAANENPGPAILEHPTGQVPLAPAWQQDPSGTVNYQQINLPNLEPFKQYPLGLRINNQHVAWGELTTLPAQLPSLTDPKPFIVLLGSCFYWKDDKGAVSAAFNRLRDNGGAHVKFLCGDQVYLDAPYYNFTAAKHSGDELRALFLNTYLQTFGQVGGRVTLYDLLRSGGNYFSPDDHEFWNNAPNEAVAVRDSRNHPNKEDWSRLAGEFYKVFQGRPQPFTVNPVSFFTADTRTNRDDRNGRFMIETDLDVLVDWIGNLKGPGVLVVGQPVFTKKGGLLAKWADLGLPDFGWQYSRLTTALAAAKHTVVILTGDVHYGRVASCTLLNGTELIEIISSPMSLVEAPPGFSLFGGWEEAPKVFNVPGSPRIRTDTTFKFARNHFLTLEFRSKGAGAQLIVRDWPFRQDGSPSSQPGRTVSTHDLK
jgi:hypothetical protein